MHLRTRLLPAFLLSPPVRGSAFAQSHASSTHRIQRRQRLDADQLRAGPDDDRPRPGALLRRAGAKKERAGAP